MSTITIRLDPTVAGPIEETLSRREGGRYTIKVSLHGGKFTAEGVDNCFVNNPDFKGQVDIGQKTRFMAIFLAGREPEKIKGQRSISIKDGDKVKGFFNLEEAKTFSAENPTVPVFVLNQDNNFSAINEFILGGGDCVLVRLSDQNDFIVKETVNGKIFSNHGVTDPASINNRRVLLAEKDKEILKVLKKYKERVTDIVVSFISSPDHVEQLYKTLVEIYGEDLPAITYKIETLEAVNRLDEILDMSKGLGLSPEIVIGCGDLESQVTESLVIDGFGKNPPKDAIRKRLEEKIEEIVSKLSKRNFNHINIAWGLGEDDDTTSKLRTILRLVYEYGVNMEYWVTKATVTASSALEVTKVLENLYEQKHVVIQELLIELTSGIVRDNLD